MTHNKIILIVDDDEDIRSFLSTTLREHGFMTISVNNGEEALEAMEMNNISLVLSDIKMPKMNGLQFYHWCVEHSKAFVILMTGLDKVLETHEAHEIGLSHFITKPINISELIRIVNSVLENKGFTEVETVKNRKSYCKISIEDLSKKKSIPYPIFLKLSEDKYLRIAHEASSLSDERVEKFKEREVHFLYMEKLDFNKYVDGIHQSAIAEIVKSPSTKKMKILLHTNELLIEKVYHNEIDLESFEDAKKFFQSTLDVVGNDDDVINFLDYFNSIDDSFYAHLLGVSVYSLMLSKYMKWHSKQTLFLVTLGGLFHDVGKRDFPIDMLFKDEKNMRPDQLQLYRDHPLLGTEIINSFHKFAPQVLQIVMQHHECCDGSGFPFNLRRESIFPLAKMIYLVDLFTHQVVSSGKHQTCTPKEAIIEIEKNHMDKVDSLIFESFKKMINES